MLIEIINLYACIALITGIFYFLAYSAYTTQPEATFIQCFRKALGIALIWPVLLVRLAVSGIKEAWVNK